MHSTLFTLLGFATAALSAAVPRATVDIKPFEITELSITKAASEDGASKVLFKVDEPNSNQTTYCSGDNVRPNEINFCNGLPQFVFGPDFSTLSVSWMWPDSLDGQYSVGSGIANVSSGANSLSITPTNLY